MNKKRMVIEKMIIILGSALVAFGIYNIHSRFGIAEGGELGIELLIYNWFKISPAIVSLLIDILAYSVGYLLYGKKFLLNAIIGTLSYSIFYYIFEQMPVIIPDLSNHLLLASILGGLIVGIGCGLVLKMEGACGGDDSIALILSKITKLSLSLCYFLLDLIVILLSLSYISFDKIIYSLLTAMISSLIIGRIAKKNRIN